MWGFAVVTDTSGAGDGARGEPDGDQRVPGGAQRTWNDAPQIEVHRRMSVEERVLRTIELSRAALAFAAARRSDRAPPR